MDWTTEYALCSYGWLFLSACLGPARSKNAVLFDRSSSPSTFYIYYDVLCIAVWASERSSTTTAGGVASAPHVYIYCIVFSTRQCRCIYTHSFLFLPSSLYFSLFFCVSSLYSNACMHLLLYEYFFVVSLMPCSLPFALAKQTKNYCMVVVVF